jgi:hypothetical protein
MNRPSDTSHHLHLVADEPAAGQDKISEQLAAGVLKFHTLWSQFDEQMFSGHPDYDEMGRLILEINTLRQRLAAHGVQV